jgi:cysteine rich repeat protein
MKNPTSSSAGRSLVMAIFGSALAFAATAAFAAEDIVESARVSCQKDIDSYCKDVTRGEGRILQCLAAHEDKLSGRCTYALDDASLQLQRVGLAIKYVAMQCKSDLEKHCADIPVGDGRIAQCLKKNDATLAADCKQSLKDTQMEIK